MLSKFKQMDHYQRAIAFAFPISLCLLLYILAINPGDLLVSDWLINLILIPGFIGNILSGSTYIARAIDAAPIKRKTTKQSQKRIGLVESMLTTIGIIVGLVIAVTFVILKLTTPFIETLSQIAVGVSIIARIGTFAGIGNRIGSCIDQNAKPINEKIVIGLAISAGLIMGTVLLLTAGAALISVAGVTSFFTAGTALPAWIAGVVFIASLTSTFASSADYTAKAGNFIYSSLFINKPISNVVKQRHHEYRGSMLGVSAGLSLGCIIVVMLALSNPLIFTGLVGIIAALMVITTSISVIGGICSRVGRFIDGVAQQDTAPTASVNQLSQRKCQDSSYKIINLVHKRKRADSEIMITTCNTKRQKHHHTFDKIPLGGRSVCSQTLFSQKLSPLISQTKLDHTYSHEKTYSTRC